MGGEAPGRAGSSTPPPATLARKPGHVGHSRARAYSVRHVRNKFAIRRGEAIHLLDRNSVRDHFAVAIHSYRLASHAGKWTPVEMDTRQLGEHSVFATVHWNALDADGQVVRDTWTSYQLLATPDGWRFISYTNHF